jgi:hypothetical protein
MEFEFRADLHNHLRTVANMDGLYHPMMRIASRRLGNMGVLGVVDFENYGDNSRYAQIRSQAKGRIADLGNSFYDCNYGVFVVKGQEVQTDKGHILVIGLNQNQFIKSGKNVPLEDALKESKDKGGIIIADHPFYKEGIGEFLISNPDYIQNFDGYEVHNGEAALHIPRLLPKYANEQANDFNYYNYQIFKRYGVGLLSFSDGHSINEIARSFTTLYPDEPLTNSNNYFEFRDLLRKSIKKAKFVDGTRRDAKLGALGHIAALTAVIAASKVGIKL